MYNIVLLNACSAAKVAKMQAEFQEKIIKEEKEAIFLEKKL